MNVKETHKGQRVATPYGYGTIAEYECYGSFRVTRKHKPRTEHDRAVVTLDNRENWPCHKVVDGDPCFWGHELTPIIEPGE